ncbi:TadE family type IV pilus minor pilin [Kribbella qitaiheensis]|uniref:TadE family type IV pilus minor pilin n=1 Tax=Kribbella qitaiheensis TaxID=1544730 RepID=UPI003610D8F0
MPTADHSTNSRTPDRARPVKRARVCRRRGDRGTVTAEVAILLPVLVGVMILGLSMVGVVTANIRCIDAARDAARATARGEPLASAQHLGQRAAPPDSTITITQQDAEVQVLVTSKPHLSLPVVGGLLEVPVRAEATVQTEPGTRLEQGVMGQ